MTPPLRRPLIAEHQTANLQSLPGITDGSGIGPERALEAINKTPRAQRESGASFELPCERRSGSAGSTLGIHPIRCERPNPQRPFPHRCGREGGQRLIRSPGGDTVPE